MTRERTLPQEQQRGEFKDGLLDGQGKKTHVRERNGSGRQIIQVRKANSRMGS